MPDSSDASTLKGVKFQAVTLGKLLVVAVSVRLSIVGLSLVLLLAGCGGSSHKPPAASSTSDMPTTSTASTSTVAPTTTSVPPPGLKAVTWGDISVPGSLCFQSSPIQLHNGQAQRLDSVHGYPNAGSSGPSYVDIEDNYAPVRYFDLAPGVPVAFVPIECNNNGGTADGVILYALLVYEGGPGHVTLIGTIRPRVQPPDVLPTLLGVQSVTAGRIVVSESWYRPHDGTCCPSGKATSTWGYSHGAIYPMSSTGGPPG